MNRERESCSPPGPPGMPGPVCPVGPIRAESQIQGPVVELAASPEPRLRPGLAVVLGADVPPGALPGAVARAVTGVFLAVRIGYAAREDGGAGFLLGEHLLPLNLAGELRLHLSGEPVAVGCVTELGDPVDQITRLATRVNGLRAGDTVCFSSRAADAPAAPGTLLLEGPLGSLLTAELRGAA